MKQIGQKIDKKLWVASLIVGVVVTALVGKLPFIHKTLMMVIFLLLSLFACWTGWYLRKQSRGWQLLVFPACFMIGAYFFVPRYCWYLVLVYLGLAYLSWSLAREQNN